MTKVVKSKLVWILFGGILLRLFLAATTFHPDIRAFNLAGQLIGSGNILNLYDYLGSCTPDNPLLKTFGADLFIYPPIIYLFHGIFNVIFSFIFSNQMMNGFLIDQPAFFGNWLFNLHLLLLKVPYLLFDIPAAFAIAALFENPKQKVWAFALWVFNPIVLYSGYMMGQFDLIPASLTVFALLALKKKKFYYAALAIGFGAAFKLYPLFLVIPMVLSVKSKLGRLGLLGLSVLPYVMFALPFIHSHGFRAYALMAGLTQKTLYAQIPVSGGEALLLFPLTLLVFYFYFWHEQSSSSNKRETIEALWQRWFVVLLSFFIFTHFHPQWLTWLSPFLVLELVQAKFKTLFLHVLMMASFIGMIFLFDPSLSVKIFAPLVPALYSLPGTWEQLGVHWDENYIRSILQTTFAAVSVFYIYLCLKDKSENMSEKLKD